jgi:hypothetical protein
MWRARYRDPATGKELTRHFATERERWDWLVTVEASMVAAKIQQPTAAPKVQAAHADADDVEREAAAR